MKHLLNLYDILEALEKRKAMYLGNDYTFSSLDNFVTGFIMAAQDGQLEKPQFPNFTYFGTWIIGHLDQYYGLSGGWHWQIHNRNLNDDQKAFQEFFYFLDIFKNSKVTSKILVVDQQAIQFSIDSQVSHYSVNEKKHELVEKKPFKIRWIQISNSTTVWIEFLDKNSDSISEHWYLNQADATNALEQEFGRLKNDWIKERESEI